jgi:hypothetical protein
MKENKKSRVRTETRTRETIWASARSPFGFLRCSAGILPALFLLASSYSGTGTLACAPSLQHSPSDLGFRTASHPTAAREEAEAHLTQTNFLIANPELEFSLSPTKSTRYKFLIANK